MISADEALARVLAHARALPAHTVALRAATGRTLARDIRAPHDMPLFTSSAVDGYALRAGDTAAASDDTSVRMKLRGEMRAGDAALRPTVPDATTSTSHTRRTAIRIFTGAPVPRGVDAVVMQEDVTLHPQGISVVHPVASGANIRPRGAEYHAGDLVLAAGTRITPPVVALLAAMGCARVPVHAQPRVAILATGNELRTVGAALLPGEIRDSNTPMLVAALAALGITDVRTRTVRDEQHLVRRALASLLADADIVLTSGGISVGEYDHVREAAGHCGVTEQFWKVAIKPGKPLYFGTRSAHAARRVTAPARDGASPRGSRARTPRNTLLFALPGNPVAALVGFHWFVRPALEALAGCTASPAPRISARLTTALTKKSGRMEYVRMIVSQNGGDMPEARPARGQESHMLGGIAAANAVYRFPADAERVEAGALISLDILHWSLP